MLLCVCFSVLYHSIQVNLEGYMQVMLFFRNHVAATGRGPRVLHQQTQGRDADSLITTTTVFWS
jgi:hypothetical protein